VSKVKNIIAVILSFSDYFFDIRTFHYLIPLQYIILPPSFRGSSHISCLLLN
jgi:hypothetical protein